MKTLKPIQILTDESIEKIERAIKVLESNNYTPALVIHDIINDLKEIVNDCKE